MGLEFVIRVSPKRLADLLPFLLASINIDYVFAERNIAVVITHEYLATPFAHVSEETEDVSATNIEVISLYQWRFQPGLEKFANDFWSTEFQTPISCKAIHFMTAVLRPGVSWTKVSGYSDQLHCVLAGRCVQAIKEGLYEVNTVAVWF